MRKPPAPKTCRKCGATYGRTEDWIYFTTHPLINMQARNGPRHLVVYCRAFRERLEWLARGYDPAQDLVVDDPRGAAGYKAMLAARKLLERLEPLPFEEPGWLRIMREGVEERLGLRRADTPE